MLFPNKNFLLLILFSLYSLSLSTLTPRTWIVDLDKPPETRWPFEEMIPVYNESINGAMGLIDKFIPQEYQKIAFDFALDVLPHLGDYGDEIRSLSKHSNLPLAKAILLNIIYEAEAGCTSIIAETDNHTILHGRNLDFDLAKYLRNLTINIDFRKGGKTLYYGTSFAGYLGLLTGMRPGAFAITANQRDVGGVWENILEAIFVPGTYAACFLIRDTLEQNTNFKDAVNRLSTTAISAPIYIIVSGINSGEGTIISRNRNNAADVWYLSDAVDNGKWFIVETNDDHWLPPEDERRETANRGMKGIGQQKINLPGIYSVLKTKPVYDPKELSYSTLMSSRIGYYTTYVE